MKAKFIAIVALVAFIGFGLMTASAQGPRTVLRIDSVKITKTECGKPLEFHIVIKNAGAQGFNKQASIIITSGAAHIGHQFLMSIGAGQTITDIQSSPNQAFVADCCKEVCFEVTMGLNGDGGVLPEWDKVAKKICTKPGNVIVVSR